MTHATHSLTELHFENSFVELPNVFHRHVLPQPLKGAHLISFNAEVARLLDLDPCKVQPDELASIFGGDELLSAFEPVAMKYTGHQFGHYNPDLGDGRGVLLGEVINHQGRRFDLHLKGAGRTPFSRMGDGRAVLRSSIREYLVSEAMHGLGIPTTRALSLVGSQEQVMRNGPEPCAAVLRVTECHIRFGHFEYLYYSRQHDQLSVLADYCIERFYPSLATEDQPYLAFYREVVQRTARLFALWQSYGFVHGVLNTDNMSILGESFDYGPFTFMDDYDPNYVSNKNDHAARYAFKEQPNILIWNLACLGQALLPLVSREDLESVLGQVKGLYEAAYYKRMSERLGLSGNWHEHQAYIDELLEFAAQQKMDMTRFLRALSRWNLEGVDSLILGDILTRPEALKPWLQTYLDKMKEVVGDDELMTERAVSMLRVNPKYLLRNYMAEEVIRDAHQGNYTGVNELLSLLRQPYDEQPDFEARYAGAPPDWAASIYLTCSS